jgi:hypothetical protein
MPDFSSLLPGGSAVKGGFFEAQVKYGERLTNHGSAESHFA